MSVPPRPEVFTVRAVVDGASCTGALGGLTAIMGTTVGGGGVAQDAMVSPRARVQTHTAKMNLVGFMDYMGAWKWKTI